MGGFSYADVLESVSNRTATILFNTELKAQFEAFYARPDTFSLALLGICNGCQLMAQLNFVPWKGIEEAKQPRFIQNKSGRFESRFVNVHVEKSNAITLQDMEGSTLGVWVAHGEGLCLFTTTVKEKAMLQNCVALKNANNGNVTMDWLTRLMWSSLWLLFPRTSPPCPRKLCCPPTPSFSPSIAAPPRGNR